MKANAIARIIIFSLVIVILLGILGVGLGIGMFTFDFGYDGGNYNEGGSSVSALTVKNIDLEWAAGSITIQTADGTDSIEFSESGSISEDTEMVYELQGDTLKICYSKPSFMIGFVSMPNKDLTIRIPSSWACNELDISAASADIAITGLQANEVSLESASGECDFRSCEFAELDIDTASGNVLFEGSLTTLDCDAASADVTAHLRNVPRQINMDGVSGAIDITLPEQCGFSVAMDTLSGKFSSDFSTTSVNGRYVYGDGSCRIDVEGVSGNVIIRKGE